MVLLSGVHQGAGRNGSHSAVTESKGDTESTGSNW